MIRMMSFQKKKVLRSLRALREILAITLRQLADELSKRERELASFARDQNKKNSAHFAALREIKKEKRDFCNRLVRWLNANRLFRGSSSQKNHLYRRRERDSNPRWALTHNCFQDSRLRPLGHPSKAIEFYHR